MNLEELFGEIKKFSEETHGSSDYDKDEIYVAGRGAIEFAPMSYLRKKISDFNEPKDLISEGFVFDSFDMFFETTFKEWYEKQFSQKLTRIRSKNVSLLHLPDNKTIFEAIEGVHKSYSVLKSQQILINGKNLPVQLGEWYAKSIFGLRQVKSASQRGFDFYLGDSLAEVKVHWADQSSPKGVKIKKTMVDLSDYCILIYLAKNFMVREVCFLDSEFVLRKFSTKGHTIFLKDVDVAQYFFSKSDKHKDKVMNKSALLKYASPQLALKMSEWYS